MVCSGSGSSGNSGSMNWNTQGTFELQVRLKGGVMDKNHEETVTKIHPSQPRFTRAHTSQDMSRAQFFPMYLQLAAHAHGCNSDVLLVLRHPARCRRPRHRGFKVNRA